jgi:putative heme-binding domain-containing protein
MPKLEPGGFYKIRDRLWWQRYEFGKGLPKKDISILFGWVGRLRLNDAEGDSARYQLSNQLRIADHAMELHERPVDALGFRTLAEAFRRYNIARIRYHGFGKVNLRRVIDVLKRFFAEAPLAAELDRDSALAVWYAVEPSDLTVDGLIQSTWKHPLLYEYLVRKRLAIAGNQQQELAAILEAMPRAPDNGCHTALLRGIAEHLRVSSGLKPPDAWRAIYSKYTDTASAELRQLLDEIGLQLGDQDVVGILRKRANDKSGVDRARAIALLSARKIAGFDTDLRALLADPAARSAAIRGLAAFADAETPGAILKVYAKLTPDEKLDAVHTLAARAPWANALLDAVEKGTIPRSDVPVTTARQIMALNDKALAARLEKVWGKITPASKERAALTKKWKEILSDGTLAKADATRGRAVYTKHCASCHKMFGEGQTVGPELTGSQRANLDYVLENVLDPSAVVPNEFRLINFTTADERVVSGIVLRETKDAVTVRTANDTVILPTADIAGRKQTNVSIMPDGLFDQLKPDEVRDLIAYLRSKEQVPLPK